MPGYISEYDHYGGSGEFIELAMPAGTDVSAYQVVIYDDSGGLDQTINLSDLTVQGTMAGHDVYVIDSGTPGFAGIDPGDSTALIDESGNVLQFVTHDAEVTAVDGPAAGCTSTYIGEASGSGNSLQSDDGGSTYYVQSSANPGTIPCYAVGTLIDTPDGPRLVETLQPGHQVLTLDRGPQDILWVRAGKQALGNVDDDARPVLIKAGALGQGLPARDLIVSPQHRILVGGGGQLTQYFDTEVFAPAKALTKLQGIRRAKGKSEITWVHFACDRHEVVFANGCQSESLLLGPMVTSGLTRAERQSLVEIYGAIPATGDALNGSAARACETVGAVRRHIAKRQKEINARTTRNIRAWDIDLAMETREAGRSPYADIADRPERSSAA